MHPVTASTIHSTSDEGGQTANVRRALVNMQYNLHGLISPGGPLLRKRWIFYLDIVLTVLEIAGLCRNCFFQQETVI